MKFFHSAIARFLTAGVLISIAGSAAAQQPYPSKPIRIIVAFAPGGSTNQLARVVGQKLTESWGQQVIIDNRPGGNTIIGTEVLFKSAPDGYTIMLMTSIHVLNGLLIPKLPYDTIKDFASVATIAGSEYVLVLHPSVSANNLQQFIALAKSKPGQLNYATSGSGTAVHLGVELLSVMAGIKMQHIPYKGASQVVADLIGGQVQLSFIVPINVLSHIRAGKLKAIAISGDARSPVLPHVPTFTEAGLPGFRVRNWFGILAPAGTPRAIINKLSAEFARIMTMPDIKGMLASQAMDIFSSTPDQFAALIKADTAKFAKIIKDANIKIEN